MPHIHTEPGQHDITVSALIFRESSEGLRALVHMHRKHQKLMQIGGHIEVNETPWQALAHEIPEESGYSLDELKILQPLAMISEVANAAVHPVPVLSNTHRVNNDHYHSDFVYAFTAEDEPKSLPAEGESTDLRWPLVNELGGLAAKGLMPRDIADIYEYVAENVTPSFHAIEARRY